VLVFVDSFEIATELTSKAVQHGCRIVEIPMPLKLRGQGK